MDDFEHRHDDEVSASSGGEPTTQGMSNLLDALLSSDPKFANMRDDLKKSLLQYVDFFTGKQLNRLLADPYWHEFLMSSRDNLSVETQVSLDYQRPRSGILKMIRDVRQWLRKLGLEKGMTLYRADVIAELYDKRVDALYRQRQGEDIPRDERIDMINRLVAEMYPDFSFEENKGIRFYFYKQLGLID